MATTKKLPTMQQVLRYWYTRLKAEEIAERLGISPTMLYRLRKRYKLPPRPADRKKINESRGVDPTEEEIAKLKQEIQASWSEAEAAKRFIGPSKPEPWTPPRFTHDYSSGTFLAR